jgi:transposase
MNAYSEDLRKKIVEGRGCELLYLPPYSPHLNPIGRAFAKLKGRLRAGLRPAHTRRL